MSSLTLILIKVGIQNIYRCKLEWEKYEIFKMMKGQNIVIF